jgi:hypothetical protein
MFVARTLQNTQNIPSSAMQGIAVSSGHYPPSCLSFALLQGQSHEIEVSYCYRESNPYLSIVHSVA